MKKLSILIFFLSLYLIANETEKKDFLSIIKKNPMNIPARVALIKEYISNLAFDKAIKIDKEILNIDPTSKDGLYWKERIAYLKKAEKILNTYGVSINQRKEITQLFKNMYALKKYNEILTLFNQIDLLSLEDDVYLIVGKIYQLNKEYKKSDIVLSNVKNQNKEYKKIAVYNCFYSKYYECSAKVFKELFYDKYELKYAIGLIKSDIFLQKFDEAKEVLHFAKEKYPDNYMLISLENDFFKNAEDEVSKARLTYLENPNFINVKSYFNALLNKGQKAKAIEIMVSYLSKNPYDFKAKYWFSNFYYNEGEYLKALDIINTIVEKDDYTSLLYAKLLAKQKEYKKSNQVLLKVIPNLKSNILKSESMKILIRNYYALKQYENVIKYINIYTQNNSLDNELTILLQKSKLSLDSMKLDSFEKDNKEIKKEKIQKPLYILTKEEREDLLGFFNTWKKYWEELDFIDYTNLYDTSFATKRWLLKKERIFDRLSFVKIKVKNMKLKKLSNNKYEIKFEQYYSSDFKKDIGIKTLIITKNDGEFLILKESWRPLK